MDKKQQNHLTVIGITLTLIGAIVGGVNLGNNVNNNLQTSVKESSPQPTATEDSASSSKIESTPSPVVETKTETSTKEIPFQTKTVDDNTLAKGTTKITTKGVNGIEETTYTVTYTDGKETSREVTKVEVTKEPVTQIVAQGTYVVPKPTTSSASTTSSKTPTSNKTTTAAKPATTTTTTAKPASQNCTNGTYVNSNGQTVCRPSATNNGNASAICKDGTYSYSQHRRGTCSGHKGVKTWLKNLPK